MLNVQSGRRRGRSLNLIAHALERGTILLCHLHQDDPVGLAAPSHASRPGTQRQVDRTPDVATGLHVPRCPKHRRSIGQPEDDPHSRGPVHRDYRQRKAEPRLCLAVETPARRHGALVCFILGAAVLGLVSSFQRLQRGVAHASTRAPHVPSQVQPCAVREKKCDGSAAACQGRT